MHGDLFEHSPKSAKKSITGMHSSRMRTVRLLTVSRSLPRGVSTHGIKIGSNILTA